MMTGNGHDHRTFRYNLQPTVSGNAEVNIEVAIAVREVGGN